MEYFELTCEDLTNIGGPMGTETTSVIFSRAYSTLQKAKDAAEKDHKRRCNSMPWAIKWTDSGRRINSGDLSSHTYYIEKKKVL